MSLKVLIHVNEPERWHIALNNITNMLKDDEGRSIERPGRQWLRCEE